MIRLYSNMINYYEINENYIFSIIHPLELFCDDKKYKIQL